MNLPSRGGVCGLHLSSRCGHANAVELLLDKGTIHIRDHPYITSAKRWFVGGGGQMLIFAGLGISMCGLHLSARCGHANTIQLNSYWKKVPSFWELSQITFASRGGYVVRKMMA